MVIMMTFIYIIQMDDLSVVLFFTHFLVDVGLCRLDLLVDVGVLVLWHAEAKDHHDRQTNKGCHCFFQGFFAVVHKVF